MKTKTLVLSLCLSVPMSLSLAQQSNDYVVPKTEWGQPDLQGVWNFNSSTPMQRPERFGTQEFLTPEQFEADRQREAERKAAADAAEAKLVINPQAPAAGGDSPGGYNNFWYERASIAENVRTSLIIYPPNGRFPARVEGSAVHTANLGPDVEGDRPVLAVFGGIGKDGPEDRGLSERCLIGFNAGPPFTGGGYNANVQIFQNKDHAVILTEMVHDARIVPLNASKPLDDEIRQWSGDSRGYWDGETLVVETRNFTKYTPSFSRFGDVEGSSSVHSYSTVS